VICPLCTPAESSTQQPRRGVYDFKCLTCCAQLVADARPSKRHQDAQLAAIAHFRGSPPRAKILEAVKAIPKKPKG